MANNADKRARQSANRRAAATPESTRDARVIAAVAVVVVVLAGLFAFFLVRDSPGDDGDGLAAGGSTTPCPPAEGSPERVTSFDGPPETCIDAATSAYTATFVTSEGTFSAQLDPEAAPETVNNFVVLARYGYYDDTPIHRVVPGFVIQGGDGDGEPYGSNEIGYTIADELPPSNEAYTDYSLAMANAGPDTNGSQFFVVLPGGGTQLQAAYSYFGQVTEGTEVVDTIAALGEDGVDGAPLTDVTVQTVEIDESPL